MMLMLLHKNRWLDEWSRIENQETDPYKYSQVIFWLGTKAIQWRNWIEKNGIGKLNIYFKNESQSKVLTSHKN